MVYILICLWSSRDCPHLQKTQGELMQWPVAIGKVLFLSLKFTKQSYPNVSSLWIWSHLDANHLWPGNCVIRSVQNQVWSVCPAKGLALAPTQHCTNTATWLLERSCFMLCCCRALAKGQMKNYWIIIPLEALLMNLAGLAQRECFSQGEINRNLSWFCFVFVQCEIQISC